MSRFDKLTSGQLSVLNLLSSSAASTLANLHLYKNLQESYLQAFTGLANAIEARDPYTAGHTERVCQIAELIAAQMGWDQTQLADLKIGCTLHDIGKIGVPDSILNKPGFLTDDEKEIMNSHPKVGLKIVKGIKLFKKAVPYIIAHHEWYNGKGYPRQLKGEEIPLEGRLLSVADTFDAIISDRPYRKGASVADAVSELVKYSGIQFDSIIVDVFIELLKQGKLDFKKMYGRDEDISSLEDIISTEMVPA
jgi:putative nucleotidyltransferase with HDIG domain